MGMKANHRHLWMRCLQRREFPLWPYTHRLVLRCETCGKVKNAPYSDLFVKCNGEYQCLLSAEELVNYYGRLTGLDAEGQLLE